MEEVIAAEPEESESRWKALVQIAEPEQDVCAGMSVTVAHPKAEENNDPTSQLAVANCSGLSVAGPEPLLANPVSDGLGDDDTIEQELAAAMEAISLEAAYSGRRTRKTTLAVHSWARMLSTHSERADISMSPSLLAMRRGRAGHRRRRASSECR